MIAEAKAFCSHLEETIQNLMVLFESITCNGKFILSGLPKGVIVIRSNATVVLCVYLDKPYWISLLQGSITIKPYIGVFTHAD